MIMPSAVASALPGEDVVLLPKAECHENAKLVRAGLHLTSRCSRSLLPVFYSHRRLFCHSAAVVRVLILRLQCMRLRLTLQASSAHQPNLSPAAPSPRHLHGPTRRPREHLATSLTTTLLCYTNTTPQRHCSVASDPLSPFALSTGDRHSAEYTSYHGIPRPRVPQLPPGRIRWRLSPAVSIAYTHHATLDTC